MKVIIHIGPPKTGTSAIQNWCAQNSRKLLDSGVYYPTHDVDANGVSSGNLLSVFTRSEETQKLTFSQTKLDTLLDEAKRNKADTVLLSSEFFFKNVDELAARIPNAIFVAYVRFELSKLESSYNQSVKRHGKTDLFSLPKTPKTQALSLLKKYTEKYGSDRFLLRAYSTQIFEGGNIVADFISLLNKQSLSVNNGEVKTINAGYSAHGLEVKRWFNKFELGPLQNKLDQFLQHEGQSSPKYSLIGHKQFCELKSKYIEELESFCCHIPFHNCNKLLDEARGEVQPPVCIQNIGIKSFSRVVEQFISYDEEAKKLLIDFSRKQKEQSLDHIDELRLTAIEQLLPSSKIHKSAARRLPFDLLQTALQAACNSVCSKRQEQLSAFEKLRKWVGHAYLNRKSFPNVTLVSHHIPHTVDASFREALANVFGKAAIYDVFKETGAKELTRGERIWLPAKTKVVHGHFKFTQKSKELFPNALRVCWVRDPLERAWLHFHHILDHEWPAKLYLEIIRFSHEEGIVKKEEIFEAAIMAKKFPQLTSAYSKYLSKDGLPFFDFIGSAANYESELRRLSKIVGVPLEGESQNQNIEKLTLPPKLGRLEKYLAEEYELVSAYL